jgi:predicted cobalt transporter CbtA
MADSSISHETTTSASQAQQEPETTEALAAPTQSKSLGWTLLYGLANAIIGIGNITFYTILPIHSLARFLIVQPHGLGADSPGLWLAVWH